MKAQTIKKVLAKKLGDWLSSIEDPDVQNLAMKHVVVTGGAIASALLKEPINDYDLYFTKADTTEKVAQYYADKANIDITVHRTGDRVRCNLTNGGFIEESDQFVEGLLEDEEVEDVSSDENKKSYRVGFISENAITLSNQIQIITRFCGKPSEIHKNFDFVHATCWYRLKSNKLILPPEALYSLLSKDLIYRGSLYPVCSMFRMRKFIRRGWTITAGEMLKIALQISELNLRDIDTLREQLTGVDALYFYQLLRVLEEQYPDKPLEGSMVIDIIDRMHDRYEEHQETQDTRG